MNPESVERLREKCEAFINVLAKAWESIKKLMRGIAKVFWEGYNVSNKSVGYKRKAKAQQIAYYKTVSADKSNNWRKTHGLPLARSRC